MVTLRKLLLTLALLLVPSALYSQTTNITATITDSDSQAWFSGTWQATFVPNPSSSGPYYYQGTIFQPQTYAGTMNGSGAFSVTLPDNAYISPAGSKWLFVICPYASAPCTQITTTVTGASQNFTTLFSSSVQAPRFTAVAGSYGYGTFEVKITPLPGGTFFNVSVPCAELWNGSAFACTTSGSYQVVQNNSVSQPQQPKLNFLSPLTVTNNTGNNSSDITCALLVGVGASNAAGCVPAPGAVSHNPKYYFDETGNWSAVPGGGTTAQNPMTTGGLSNGAFPWNLGGDLIFPGPNPYVDARNYGVRAVVPTAVPAIPGITVNISNGSNIATISSASTFQNGDGVVIYNAGAGTISAPSAPTVTPSESAAQTNMLLDVNGPTGSATYCYQIMARKLQGATNISSEVCTGTGPASLGLQTISNTSVALANNVATYTTAASHGLVAGAAIVITGVSTLSLGGANGGDVAAANPFNGWFTVNSVIDATHFTVLLMSDSRNGAPTAGTGGSVNYWNDIRITATATTNNFEYYVYGRVTGSSKSLIGVMLPQNAALAGDATYLVFQDFGSTVSTFTNPPSYIPTTLAGYTPGNDMLSATILSGAGTTTLTLSTTAGNPVSGGTILFDDAINVLTAATAAANTGAGTSGALVLPWPGNNTNYYVFNYPISLGTGGTSRVAILQKGNVYINEPITMSFVQWYGETTSNNQISSFSNQPAQAVIFGKASPGMYATNNVYLSDMAWSQAGANGGTMFVQDAGGIPAAGTYKNMTLSPGNGSTSYSNMAMVFRGGAGFDFPNTTLSSSQNGSLVSTTPGIYFDNTSNANFKNLLLSGVGIGTRANSQGGSYLVDHTYCQACYEPYFSFAGSGPANFMMVIDNTVFDTNVIPLVANYGGTDLYLSLRNNSASSQDPVITGIGGTIGSRTIVDITGGTSPIAPNTGTAQRNIYQYTRDAVFGASYYPEDIINRGQAIGQGYSLFTSTGPFAAPSCPVASGGSVTIGTSYWYYVPIYSNGSEGAYSQVCSATTSSGNQTINLNWTAVPGASSYSIYTGTAQDTIGYGCAVSTNSLSVTSGATCSIGGSASNSVTGSGGPAGMQNGNLWGNDLILSTVSAPTGATGKTHTYMDSTSSWPAFKPNGNVPYLFMGISAAGWTVGYCPTASSTVGLFTLSSSCGGGIPSGSLYSLQWSNVSSFGNTPAPTGPANAVYVDCSIPNGSGATAPQYCQPGVAGRSNAGATDIILYTDRATRVEETNSGPTAVSLPAAGATSFGSNFMFKIKSDGGTSTVTPASGTINGQLSWPAYQGEDCTIQSPDNANWTMDCHEGQIQAGANISIARTQFGPTISSIGGGGGGGGPIYAPALSIPVKTGPIGFSSNSTVTVANSSSATSLVGTTVNGIQAVPPNTMMLLGPGPKTFEWQANGVISTLASTPGNITITPVLGGVTVDTITLASANVPTSLSGAQWTFEYKMTVTGLTTAEGGGCLEIINSSNQTIKACSSQSSITGLNFISNQITDLKWTWATASASNTVTSNKILGFPLQQF